MGKESKDALGDRMKGYEKREAIRALAFLPVIARLDGRGFSKLTKGMKRPYDQAFVDCMQRTTEYLVKETGAQVGYTQSDEITLAWRNGEKDSVFFDGKFQKMCSVLAAMCSLEFNRHFEQNFWVEAAPMFDCRVFQVPTVTEAVNCLVWREIDATKNSVQMLARCYFSHKDLHGKGRAEQLKMLAGGGVYWENELTHFKRGTYFARRKTMRKFTPEERENLNPRHQAIANPDLEVMRTGIVELDMPPITKVLHAANNLFHGQEEVEMKVFPTCAAYHAAKIPVSTEIKPGTGEVFGNTSDIDPANPCDLPEFIGSVELKDSGECNMYPHLVRGKRGCRTHEECVECKHQDTMPMPCEGHVSGPNACIEFEKSE